MSFAHPAYLLLLVPIVLLVIWELTKKESSISFSNLDFFKTAARRGRVLKHMPLAFYTATLVLIVIALARPQKGRIYEEQETKGVDIMLCLDISGTMQAEDFSPLNRLYVAKERAKVFVSKRAGDRIGLVIFASQALTQCPLTTDHKVLTDLIDRVDLGIIQDGTAIGMGLATAAARLRDSKAKEKIIILLTDGLNNTGEIAPLTAAQLAQAYGIKIYCIGVGSKGPVPIPVYDPVFGKQYARVEVDLDMNMLNEISALTSGQAFLATDSDALKAIYDEIDKLEPTTFKVAKHTLYQERAGIFMLPAVILLGIALFLSSALLRRLP
ncbi:MAG TPA: VWA domain-containing protein [bacterium]